MKNASTLKKVTIAALVLMLIAMLLEMVLVRGLALLSYESLAFFPVRFLTLVATNMLGGCIFTKILKMAFLSKMSEDILASYRNASLPIFWISAILILFDCAKDAYLNPDTTTVSLLLVSTFLLLTAVCAFLASKCSDSRERLGYIAGAVLVLAGALAVLGFFAFNLYTDLTALFK